jgi:hypothetical protein
MKTLFFLFLLISITHVSAQSDSVNESYYDNFIFYSDLGYYSCPFNVKVNKLGTFNYRNNIKPFVGIGLVYKWGSIRIGSLINYNLKGLDNYSDTKIFKIGTEFFYKRFLFDLSYYRLVGYTLLGNSSLLNNYKIYNDLTFQSFSVNSWFFLNKNFSHHALKGIKQSVKKNNLTLYLKNTNAFTLIQNPEIILPSKEILNLNKTAVEFNKIQAFEIGLLGGVAVATKIKQNYQFGGMFGYGGVIIDRSINNSVNYHNQIGLSSRYDFHLYFGYNKKKFFLMNYLDLEYRKMEFIDYEIDTRLVSYRLVGGYRF